MEANLSFGDECALKKPVIDPNALCNHSNIKVEGYCQNDSIHFVVQNQAEEDMLCHAPINVYIDGQLLITDSVRIKAGEKHHVSYPADGRTWRLEVGKYPEHRVATFVNQPPSATVEVCGNLDNWTPGFFDLFPLNDAEPVVDKYCGMVRGSYDPNDKAGTPSGIGEDRKILPNQGIEYLIRFQNTGNDTAFTGVIRDTLESNLDIFTVRSGVSSHDYTFRIYDGNILEWRFENILLPDSTTDEPGSNGFVKFTVSQMPDLPNGTEIRNDADIYFDFNKPIITNETLHTVDDMIQEAPAWSGTKSLHRSACDHYSLNGYTYNKSGHYLQRVPVAEGADSLVNLYLSVGQVDTTVMKNDHILTANMEGAIYQWLDQTGKPIMGETGRTFEAPASGSYAVVVEQGACKDTSALLAVVISSLGAEMLMNEIKLVPNPTHGLLKVQFGKEMEDVEVTLFNALGQQLEVLNVSGQQAELDLGAYRSGMYWVKIKQGATEVMKKVIRE